jgi:hypothetical protein
MLMPRVTSRLLKVNVPSDVAKELTNAAVDLACATTRSVFLNVP